MTTSKFDECLLLAVLGLSQREYSRRLTDRSGQKWSIETDWRVLAQKLPVG